MTIHALTLCALDPFDNRAQEIFANRDDSELAFYCFKGGSESQTSTDKSTTVSTTTTTSIGDIGVTGKDAIEIAAVLARGVELTTRAVGEIIIPVTNAFATASLAREGTAIETIREEGATARASIKPRIIKAEAEKTPSQLIGENLPLIALGIGAVIVFRSFTT